MNIGSLKQQENGDYTGRIDTFGYTAESITIAARRAERSAASFAASRWLMQTM